MKLAMIALLIRSHRHRRTAGGNLRGIPADNATEQKARPAAHGFSEILYQFSLLQAANNGSAFERPRTSTWGSNKPNAPLRRLPCARRARTTTSAPAPPCCWKQGGSSRWCRAASARRRPRSLKKPTPHTVGTPANVRHADVFALFLLGTILLVWRTAHAGGHAGAGGGTLTGAVPFGSQSQRTAGAGAGADAMTREGRPRPRTATTATGGRSRSEARPLHGAGAASQGSGRPGRLRGECLYARERPVLRHPHLSAPGRGGETVERRDESISKQRPARMERGSVLRRPSPAGQEKYYPPRSRRGRPTNLALRRPGGRRSSSAAT